MMFPSFDYKKESTMFPFSLSFARDKYINTYIERQTERVIMWTLPIPFYNKVQGYEGKCKYVKNCEIAYLILG